MRLLCPAILFFWLSSAAAHAAEIRVLSPGVVFNAGLIDLAAKFSDKTGVKVLVLPDLMGRIESDMATRQPAPDLIVLPMDMMGTAALKGEIDAATFTPLGRVEVGLAVKAGAPHPDISTVEKLAAALKSAQEVVYSNPAGGMSMEAGIIDRLLRRPEFSGVHAVISAKGEGGQALARGQGDMALQLICEIYPYPQISLVGPLPPELGAHIDSAIAVTSRGADPDNALAFIRFITRPEAAPLWRKKGLDRF